MKSVRFNGILYQSDRIRQRECGLVRKVEHEYMCLLPKFDYVKDLRLLD